MADVLLPREFLQKSSVVHTTGGSTSTKKHQSSASASSVVVAQSALPEKIANDDRDKGAEGDSAAEKKTRQLSAVLDTTTTFKELGICEELVAACTAMGYKFPTKIQKESIPYAIQGRDIIGLAQTGSGKTAAFALPIVQDLLKQHSENRASATGGFGLVVAPTRELAIQIAKQFEALGAGISLRVAVLVGGMETMQQCIALAKKPHIIVGTPGRIVYHLENTRGFTLRNVKYLVLDEADRLLNLDFEQELNTILKVLPKERHTYLFSATMTTKVQKLQRASLNNPVKVEVSTKYATVETLVQQYMFVPAKHKDCYLVFALTELAGNSIIIFTATCVTAQKTTVMLRNLGFAAIPLHGNMSQPKRLAALNKFQAGERKILVATDVASRGLDIPLVDIVINYDTPTHSKDYIHRVGRTARAGASGRAISLVTQYDVELFQRIEEMIGIKMELYKTEEEQVLTLLERVTEAQQIAAMELREAGAIKKDKNKDADVDDRDTGNELKLKKRPAKDGKNHKGHKNGPKKFKHK